MGLLGLRKAPEKAGEAPTAVLTEILINWHECYYTARKGGEENRMTKRKVLVKSGFTFLLLAFLVYRMDLREFLRILVSADIVLLLLAALVHIGTIFVSVTRWRIILDNFNIRIDFSSLTKISFIGNFFNLFLPSAIGGDVFRAYYLSKRKQRSMSTTLTSTMLERSAGLCALLAIGTVFVGAWRIEVQGVWLLYCFLFLIVIYILANVALFHSWIHRKITSFLRRRKLTDLDAKMELVYQGLNTLRRNGTAISTSLLLSLLIQFLSVLIVWIAARSIAIEAPFYAFLIFIPMITLAIMIPLTINGIGLRESAYYLLFSQIGVPVESAISLSFLNFLVVAIASLPGAIVYSLYKKEEHFDEMLRKAEASGQTDRSAGTL